MKKATNSSAGKQESPEMLREYGFKDKRGVRGKYYQAYCQGHTVRIREDGTVNAQHFTSEKGVVMLASDVRKTLSDVGER